MKFSTKEDIEAPIDAVFEMLCDFETFERAAMRRGAEVQRTDTKSVPGVGMAWRAAFNLRGKRRQAEIEMISFDKPDEMVFECRSQGVLTMLNVELVALSKNRTRVMMSFDIKPIKPVCTPVGSIAKAGKDVADKEI